MWLIDSEGGGERVKYIELSQLRHGVVKVND